MPLDENKLLSLLTRLHDVGIWLRLKPDGTLIVGPPTLVKEHDVLMANVKPYKEEIKRLIQTQLAHALFGDEDDDERFESAECPVCRKNVYVMAIEGGTRQLAVHRVNDSQVCCGGGRAALVPLASSLSAFLKDRTVSRPGGLLTFRSLWGAYQAWGYARQLLPLPSHDMLQAEMDTRFQRQDTPQGPAWVGLGLTLQQWLGDKPRRSAIAPKKAVPDDQVKMFVG